MKVNDAPNQTREFKDLKLKETKTVRAYNEENNPFNFHILKIEGIFHKKISKKKKQQFKEVYLVRSL